MSINSRVKTVRNELDLTQIEFGGKTGISQGHLTSIESGKRAVTEKTLKVICATFNINEEWLRTGEGDMFIEDDNVLLAQLAKQYNLDAFARRFVEVYVSLPESSRNVIKEIAYSLIDESAATAPPVPEVAIDGSVVADSEIARELASYAQELKDEKRVAEKLSALQDAKES